MKKYLTVLLILVFVIPSIAFASWWNPFSWFKKNPNSEQNTQVKPNSPIEVVKPVKEKPLEKASISKKPSKSIKESSQSNPTKSNYVNPVTPVVIPQAKNPITQLTISDITFTSTPNSVNVSWQTNINSESKIIFNGDVYQSRNGVGLDHSAEITNLDSGLTYNATITAQANNAWNSQVFSFTTQKMPLQISDIQTTSCSANSCTINWRTNYVTNGIVTFTSSNGTVTRVSGDSNNMSYSVVIETTPATNYFFVIKASTSTESVEASGNFISQSNSGSGNPGSGGGCGGTGYGHIFGACA